jgi:hypothetical protein
MGCVGVGHRRVTAVLRLMLLLMLVPLVPIHACMQVREACLVDIEGWRTVQAVVKGAVLAMRYLTQDCARGLRPLEELLTVDS